MVGEILSFPGTSVPDEQHFYDQAFKLSTAALASQYGFGGLERPRLRYVFGVIDPKTGDRFMVELPMYLDGHVVEHKLSLSHVTAVQAPDDRLRAFRQAAGSLPTVHMIAPAAMRWREHIIAMGCKLEWERWEYFAVINGIPGWCWVE